MCTHHSDLSFSFNRLPEEHLDPVIDTIKGFHARPFDPHAPEIMCVTCIDGRERGGGNFQYNDNALRVTEIAAVIPPYDNAPYNTRAKFSLRKLKNVSTIQIVGHSFCGGAQTAIAYPDVHNTPDPEIRDIVQSLAESGADIPRLRHAFMLSCEGNASHAANLLSRHLVLVSLHNISSYPHINQQIMNRQLDVIPLYHMLKEGTGENSHLDRYDVARKRWLNIGSSAVIPNMCERPKNCSDCSSCNDTIEGSLKWVPVEYSNDNNDIEAVEVPFHIAQLISERRAFFQPQLHERKSIEAGEKNSEICATEYPVRFYPRPQFDMA